MTRIPLEARLGPVPIHVRRRMLEDRERLEPGAAAAMARFWQVVARRREPPDAPSAAAFREVATSESTLATLLRALARYAPETTTASARDVRGAFYRQRGGRAEGQAQRSRSAGNHDTSAWPQAWRDCLPGLRAARIRDSSKRRYLASIDRCAAVVAAGTYGHRLDFYTACCLAEDFENDGVRPITIAGYLDGLIALGRCGRVSHDDLNGMRYMRTRLAERAALGEKLKAGRIAELTEKGGFDFITTCISELIDEAETWPDHASHKQILRQQIALCMLHLNKPARTSDVAAWRIGQELARAVDGTWRLEWTQRKTGHETEAGDLWEEVSAALDALLLGGRPSRFVHMRYRELLGKNWLTHCDHAQPDNWPSAMIKAAVTVPSHDLRTVAADFLRRHDPATAANVISALLGHKTREAGEDYRALAEGDAATRSWQAMRRSIAKAS